MCLILFYGDSHRKSVVPGWRELDRPASCYGMNLEVGKGMEMWGNKKSE
jgi:hypothetical protein